MDLEELKEILRILDEREIAEFELEEAGIKLRIRKAAASQNHGSAVTAGPLVVQPLLPVGAPAPSPPGAVASATAEPAPAAPPAQAEPAGEQGLVVAKSPIVGTFYRSPNPDAPPFVSVGDRVKVGQVLCIVEAMKLMNEIEAETAGEIVLVHPENGQPVQYGEPLFTIRPSR